MAAWRLPAALAAHALGRVDEAQAFADEEIALSRATGAPRQNGAALTVRGRVATGAQQISMLKQAVGVLEASKATLLHAEALCHLGAAQRRRGVQTAARESLLQARELAHLSGANRWPDRCARSSTLSACGRAAAAEAACRR